MRYVRLTLLGTLIVSVLLIDVATQQARPVFDVASVRPNRSGSPAAGGPSATIAVRPGGAFDATNATLESLILYAFGPGMPGGTLRADQLVGGPSWIRTDRYDIRAAATGDEPRDRIALMLQALLEDRFGLALRRDTRQDDVYVLTVAREDGRLGPDLRRVDDDCRSAPLPGDPAAAVARMPRPSSGGRASFAAFCETMATLVRFLERRLAATVTDRTDLTGMWDFVVTHREDFLPATLEERGGFIESPSLFVALEEQLGLKLQREAGAGDVLVIESVRQPSEN
jgi:uncharacterized protein (TIGR03435 family)